MAYNDTKVVVVDIFCFREAIVDVFSQFITSWGDKNQNISL